MKNKLTIFVPLMMLGIIGFSQPSPQKDTTKIRQVFIKTKDGTKLIKNFDSFQKAGLPDAKDIQEVRIMNTKGSEKEMEITLKNDDNNPVVAPVKPVKTIKVLKKGNLIVTEDNESESPLQKEVNVTVNTEDNDPINLDILLSKNGKSYSFKGSNKKTNKKEVKVFLKNVKENASSIDDIDFDDENDFTEAGKKVKIMKIYTSPTTSEKVYQIGEGEDKFLKKIITTPTTKKIYIIVDDKNNPGNKKQILRYYRTPTTEQIYGNVNTEVDIEEIKENEIDNEDFTFAPPPPMPPMPPMPPIPPGYPQDIQVRINKNKGSQKGQQFSWSTTDDVDNPQSNRAFLGVMADNRDNGAYINDVVPNSAAQKYGLKSGDIITKINGFDINSTQTLSKIIGKFKPNDTIDVAIITNGKPWKHKNVVLGTNTENNTIVKNFTISKDFNNMNLDNLEGLAFLDNFESTLDNLKDQPKLGCSVKDLEDTTGVLITAVEQNSAAEKAGLKKDDIITMFNKKTIDNVASLKTSLKQIQAGNRYDIQYIRNNVLNTTTIKIKRKVQEADL